MANIKTLLTGKSAANMVEYGYGQVEPNHLSAQRTGQIYAQLPAKSDITKLEQGQFVKYDYANGVVDYTGAGEWMLVFNEIKLYREDQNDCEFAMFKDDYSAKIYSPYDADNAEKDYQIRKYTDIVVKDGTNPGQLRELDYTDDPFHVLTNYKSKKMPTGTTMVPRVFKTNIGDIMTTNTVNLDDTTKNSFEKVAVGDTLAVDKTTGILSNNATKTANETMKWQIVKKYTLPDGQKAVKIMRIA